MNQEDLDLFNQIKDIPIIKQYDELLSKMSTFDIENKPKEYIYKSTEKYDYVIIEPCKIIDIKDNKYYFRHTGYDGKINSKTSNQKLYLCLSLCHKSEEEIKERLDRELNWLESQV